ncbi:MAG TPA: sigma-70 family RNA polymerase sigma factor [Puia sp.]|nr:sigma-70 family RNA polymerase sigma factor [Puia sp.]
MSGYSHYTEKELLRRLAEGDEVAFSQIYHAHNTGVFSSAMTYLKDLHLAQDITQQVFIKVWETRARLPEVDNAGGYIAVITRNLVYDHFRRRTMELRKHRQFAETQGVATQDPVPKAEERDYAGLLQDAIQHLSPQQKRVYLCIHDQQMTYEEVAQTMNISRFTVKKHLELARRFVRSYIQQRLLSALALAFLTDLLNRLPR